ncbi:uncharacterized protein SPSK_09202 [Sporothrix schenckii 1099-18]|uniref:Uncharacterized protein n=1 Tax=Sporothrix schenckii 1099-18 TaxID=1397361 RepID=A0A0F2MBR0_SPOSC|nr:uncharacterized protein SPSK_09202 [Sporothrix schenckii 1099-18]KJR85596.1 hypothetical protein SPSK_09202 [Sporothrix schenckii 1099-18]
MDSSNETYLHGVAGTSTGLAFQSTEDTQRQYHFDTISEASTSVALSSDSGSFHDTAPSSIEEQNEQYEHPVILHEDPRLAIQLDDATLQMQEREVDNQHSFHRDPHPGCLLCSRSFQYEPFYSDRNAYNDTETVSPEDAATNELLRAGKIREGERAATMASAELSRESYWKDRFEPQGTDRNLDHHSSGHHSSGRHSSGHHSSGHHSSGHHSSGHHSSGRPSSSRPSSSRPSSGRHSSGRHSSGQQPSGQRPSGHRPGRKSSGHRLSGN